MASFIPVDVARVAMIPACELWTRSLNNALAVAVIRVLAAAGRAAEATTVLDAAVAAGVIDHAADVMPM